MTRFPPHLPALLCALLCCWQSHALEIRAYDAAVHDRFENFPEEPAFNPDFLIESEKIAGVGWDTDGAQRQFALVSRCHVVFAIHHAPETGSSISFLSSQGELIERQVARVQAVRNPGQGHSDLALITLSAPIHREEGVAPLPYLNLPHEDDYMGVPLVVLGTEAKAGAATLTSFRTISVNWVVSRTYRFNYLMREGEDNDARFSNGDSGSPSLVEVDGTPALLGVHLAMTDGGSLQSNFDAFIPHYVDEIDALMVADGFRMRPLNLAPTELRCSSQVVTREPRIGEELLIELELANIGGHPTGNLELEIEFADGNSPDQVEGDGWVVSNEGDRWFLRRALLDAASTSVVQLRWSAAPAIDSIQPQVHWVSDATQQDSMATSITYEPGFTSWSRGLEEPGPLDDPDKDGRPNLLEYAFGSDPLHGSQTRGVGIPPGPSFEVRDGRAIYRFPERIDRELRGLVYQPEWTARLSSGSWDRSPPDGLTSSTTSFIPGVPGFHQRTLSWPLDEAHRFIRLDVEELVAGN